MPMYTFKCTKCEHIEDYLVKMGTTETKCKKCGELATKQMSYKFSSIGLPNGHITTRGSLNSKK